MKEDEIMSDAEADLLSEDSPEGRAARKRAIAIIKGRTTVTPISLKEFHRLSMELETKNHGHPSL